MSAEVPEGTGPVNTRLARAVASGVQQPRMFDGLGTRFRLFGAAALCLAGCAHRPLSPEGLRQVHRPAFVCWIEDGAGPRSRVFREDPSYQDKLKRLDPKEADRRLQVKLAKAITRFETSDRLRAVSLANLPKERPWTNAVDPARVATTLESFLVEEVPANPPDYELLKPLGADAVVEYVIEDFGLKSVGGRATAYVSGRGRMFILGGSELWRQSFRLEQPNEPGLDPFRVAEEPELFRSELSRLLDAAAFQFAAELNPEGKPNLRQIQQEQPAPKTSEPKGYEVDGEAGKSSLGR